LDVKQSYAGEFLIFDFIFLENRRKSATVSNTEAQFVDLQMPKPSKRLLQCRRAYKVMREIERQRQEQQQALTSTEVPLRRSMRLLQQPPPLLDSCSCFPIFTCEDCMKRASEDRGVLVARFFREDIEGEGLRAESDIDASTFLMEYRGKRSTKRITGPYVLEISKKTKIWIDGAINGNESRFINHSCDPNCIIRIEPSGHRPMIFTKKRITIGEELTLKYSDELPFDCFCEACKMNKTCKMNKK